MITIMKCNPLFGVPYECITYYDHERLAAEREARAMAARERASGSNAVRRVWLRVSDHNGNSFDEPDID